MNKDSYVYDGRSYDCVKECDKGWGIWPAYDMCVPCIPNCERCDGYPAKEYTELIDVYGKDLADEIQQGYTALGMLEFGPLMTEFMFEPTCQLCAEGKFWEPILCMCMDFCSGGYT